MNHQTTNINDLPELIKEGKITKKEAVDFLAEELLCFPFHYGLNFTDEDSLSELIYRILSNSYILFDHYDESCGKFSTYFSSYLKFQVLSMKRDFMKDMTKAKALKSLEEQESQYSAIDRDFDEKKYRNLSFHPYFLSVQEKAPFTRNFLKKDNKDFENSSTLSFENVDKTSKILDEVHFSNLMDDRRITFREKKTVLVLALKYSFYLHDVHINKISRFCEIDRNELADLVLALNETLKPRLKRFEKLIERRDYLYFMHRKYMERLHESYASERTLKNLQRLYDVHTKKWNEKNEMFGKNPYKMCVSNKQIAKVLGICIRQVGYYVKHADFIRNIDINFINKEKQ